MSVADLFSGMFPKYFDFSISRMFFTVIDLLFFPYKILKSYFVEKQSSRRYFYQNSFRLVGKIFLKSFIGTTIAALIIGAVVISQVQIHLAEYLSFDLLRRIMIYLLFWEICPGLVFIVQWTRFGTTLTMDLAGMRRNQSLSAIVSMGINIEFYFLLPRLLGLIVACLLLTTWACITSIFFGHILCLLLFEGSSFIPLVDIFNALTVRDFLVFLLKSVCFSTILLSTQSYFSLTASNILVDTNYLNARAASYNFILFLFFNLMLSAWGLAL
ncbi:ABC transporter permease [Candidatus Riflebacteria bacterium]